MTNEIFETDGITFRFFKYSEIEIQQLNESKNKGRHLIGNYTFNIHKPHNPTGEYHIHLNDKGNEILSINKESGSAHDGYHGVRIPNKAYQALKQKLPDWNWPNNQILESLQYTYILEKNVIEYLRPVFVLDHKDHELKQVNSFLGFFHQFAEDPFLTGGNGGWKESTVALIENEDGYIKKVPVTCFKFKDIDK